MSEAGARRGSSDRQFSLWWALALSILLHVVLALFSGWLPVLRSSPIVEAPEDSVLQFTFNQPPDETAFTSSDVTFRVEDDIIYFDKILFEGDAISLEGRGEMNFERTMNLTFDTAVGRDDGQLLSIIVRPFLKEAGRRLLLLRVTGTLDDPRISRIPFPDVNETFQQVFPHNGGSPRPAMSRLPHPSQLLDRLKPQR